MPFVVRLPAARVTLGVGAVLLVPLIASRFSDQVVWSLSDYILAGVLLGGIGWVLELAARRAGGRTAAVGIGFVAVLVAAYGKADDAPGLVILGGLLLLGAIAVELRTRGAARRR